MTTPLHQQLFALALATLITSGVLGGLDGLALSKSAQPGSGVWASTPAAAPVVPAVPAVKPAA